MQERTTKTLKKEGDKKIKKNLKKLLTFKKKYSISNNVR